MDPKDSEWIETRLRDRIASKKQKRLRDRDPNLQVIDASQFTVELSDLAVTLTHKVEREGPQIMTRVPIPLDTGIILRQVALTYNLLRFINADDTRFDNSGYHLAYSFVTLPLIRTMIDGFYNCTAMLDDPSRSRAFRISGYYRKREALQVDEEKYSHDPQWREYLSAERSRLEDGIKVSGFTNADLDDRANRWPLLGDYLRTKPDTPHKQILRKLTLGFWREYSSISHASFDGLLSLYPIIANDKLPYEQRDLTPDAADRQVSMHIGRASGILLCLLTEIQHSYKFTGADIDQRLGKIWAAIILMPEVRELYEYRYRSLL